MWHHCSGTWKIYPMGGIHQIWGQTCGRPVYYIFAIKYRILHPWYEYMHVPFITLPFETPMYFSCGIPRGFSAWMPTTPSRGTKQNKTFWRNLLIKWCQVNNQVTSFLIFMYIICFPTYTVAVSQLTQTVLTPGFIIQISYQSIQWRFVLTKHFHFNSMIISEYKKLCCFCVGLF